MDDNNPRLLVSEWRSLGERGDEETSFRKGYRAALRKCADELKYALDQPEPTRDELLVAVRIMAAMIEREWPARLAECTETWGSARPEDMPAIRKVEAYLDGLPA